MDPRLAAALLRLMAMCQLSIEDGARREADEHRQTQNRPGSTRGQDEQ